MSINPPDINAIRDFYDTPQYKRLIDECLRRGIKNKTLTEAIKAVKKAQGYPPIDKYFKWLRRSIYWAAMGYIHSRRDEKKDLWTAIAKDLCSCTGLPYKATDIRRFYKEFAALKSTINPELGSTDKHEALPEPIYFASPSIVAISEGIIPRSSPYQERTYQSFDSSLFSHCQPLTPYDNYANTVGASQSRYPSVNSSLHGYLTMQPHGKPYYRETVSQASPSNPSVQPYGWIHSNYNASPHQSSPNVASNQNIDPALLTGPFFRLHRWNYANDNASPHQPSPNIVPDQNTDLALLTNPPLRLYGSSQPDHYYTGS